MRPLYDKNGFRTDNVARAPPGGRPAPSTLRVLKFAEYRQPRRRVDSPPGLSVRDELLAVDGTRLTSRSFQALLGGHKAGEKIKVVYARRGRVHETELTLAIKSEPGYKITPSGSPSAAEKALLDAWLR